MSSQPAVIPFDYHVAPDCYLAGLNEVDILEEHCLHLAINYLQDIGDVRTARIYLSSVWAVLSIKAPDSVPPRSEVWVIEGFHASTDILPPADVVSCLTQDKNLNPIPKSHPVPSAPDSYSPQPMSFQMADQSFNPVTPLKTTRRPAFPSQHVSPIVPSNQVAEQTSAVKNDLFTCAGKTPLSVSHSPTSQLVAEVVITQPPAVTCVTRSGRVPPVPSVRPPSLSGSWPAKRARHSKSKTSDDYIDVDEDQGDEIGFDSTYEPVKKTASKACRQPINLNSNTNPMVSFVYDSWDKMVVDSIIQHLPLSNKLSAEELERFIPQLACGQTGGPCIPCRALPSKSRLCSAVVCSAQCGPDCSVCTSVKQCTYLLEGVEATAHVQRSAFEAQVLLTLLHTMVQDIVDQQIIVQSAANTLRNASLKHHQLIDRLYSALTDWCLSMVVFQLSSVLDFLCDEEFPDRSMILPLPRTVVGATQPASLQVVAQPKGDSVQSQMVSMPPSTSEVIDLSQSPRAPSLAQFVVHPKQDNRQGSVCPNERTLVAADAMDVDVPSQPSQPPPPVVTANLAVPVVDVPPSLSLAQKQVFFERNHATFQVLSYSVPTSSIMDVCHRFPP
ncbi:hypothetical protein C8J56DRAFT_1052570 [Mycena floridula]|nr:hypothetical protein C8J56DRAFT_1052570 [Mycena floridula]